jgi:hypothetical protein
MSVTVQDVLNLVEDQSGANAGAQDQARKIRQIGIAIDFFKRKGLLPNDESIQSFYYSDDQYFYACSSDFMEEVDLLYHNPALNTAGREWEYVDDKTLLKRLGQPPAGNKWSFTTVNGSRQLILSGQNMTRGSLLDSMESVGNWTVQGDASGLEVDGLDFQVGQGGFKFDVSAVSTGLAGVNDPSVSLDLQTLFEKHGYVKVWTKLPSASVDAVRLRLYVSALKYWTITATAFDDGSAFSANSWKKLAFALDDAVKTSTPEITDEITKVEIEFDLGASFTSGTFRVDHLFTSVPDYMDLIYRDNLKGETAAGVAISTLTDVTDKIGVGEMFPDIIELIAKRAAINLWPGLRGDKDFMMMYTQDLKDLTRDVGMRFPRRRKNKLEPTRLMR